MSTRRQFLFQASAAAVAALAIPKAIEAALAITPPPTPLPVHQQGIYVVTEAGGMSGSLDPVWSAGDLYCDTGGLEMRVWNGGKWVRLLPQWPDGTSYQAGDHIELPAPAIDGVPLEVGETILYTRDGITRGVRQAR